MLKCSCTSTSRSLLPSSDALDLYRFLSNRQPGKALPYVLRLRRPNVFDLIRDHNLLTDVQDQALLLIEFDQELVKRRREAGENEGLDDKGRSPGIALLVDHTFSIPVSITIPSA